MKRMPRRTRLFVCEDCGHLVMRKRLSNQLRICTSCGRDRRRYQHKPWKRPTPGPPLPEEHHPECTW